jgi:tetratricopeptide (TPR) repeat protein
MLSLETEDRRAFEAALEAVRAINRFKTAGERLALIEALTLLQTTTNRDPNYLLPRYYTAVIEDLLGYSDDAAGHYSELLELVPVHYRKLRWEIRLGLAAAQYHGYEDIDLQKANRTVGALLSDEQVVLSRPENRGILGYADALRAQLLATSMIPKRPEDMQSPQRRASLETMYKDAVAAAEKVLAGQQGSLLALRRASNDEGIIALARNARAMAHMYFTDYMLTVEEKIKLLASAMVDLQKDDKLFPGDALYYCGLASCHLRLGYWRKTPGVSDAPSQGSPAPDAEPIPAPQPAPTVPNAASAHEFRVAEVRLKTVIEQLRPKYGFAWFERGRVQRLQWNFENALECFEEAKKAPARERDVSMIRIEREIYLAESERAYYP